MRPLNLTPPEERRGDNAPLRVGALSYVIVGVLAVALVIVTALVLTNNKINDNRTELAQLQARQASAQQAAASLAPYQDFASLTSARNATVSTLAKSRFDWDRVLQELALVIPEDVTLESLTGTATAASSTAAAPTGGASDTTGPTLEISGCAQGQEGTARFLASLRDIDGVTRVGMQSSALGTTDSGTAAAPTSPDSGATGCDARTGVADFQITVAFDAVPVAATDSTSAATPAAATTTPTTTPAPTASSNDGGVAQTQGEQANAVNSANQQTRRATDRANTVGVGK